MITIIKLSGIDYESFVDAEGVSCVLFISGCKHCCKGCHSTKTHDFEYGLEITDNIIFKINEEIDKRPFLNALVLSGGDPMYSAKELLDILPKIHVPNNNIWLYTGFTWEQIFEPAITDDYNPERDELLKKRMELVKQCKVLVDGMYVDELRDITLLFRGSSNQRIIDVQESLKQNKIVLYNK